MPGRRSRKRSGGYTRDRGPPASAADVDAGLYDGFVGEGDKRRFSEVRATAPHALGSRVFAFSDARLPELLFRYRARNWPDTLTHDERPRWDDYRRRRLSPNPACPRTSLDSVPVGACTVAHGRTPAMAPGSRCSTSSMPGAARLETSLQ